MMAREGHSNALIAILISILSHSIDIFLSACLPSSIALEHPPYEHPPTDAFPAAQDEAPSDDAAHASTRGGSGARVEFSESLRRGP
jgi:hypothetical protein